MLVQITSLTQISVSSITSCQVAFKGLKICVMYSLSQVKSAYAQVYQKYGSQLS